MLERVRRWPSSVILAIAWLGVVLYAHPGYMSFDSIQALHDAREDTCHDLAAVVWRVMDVFIPGPFGMLLVQVTAFLAGTYFVLRRWFAPATAAWCALGVAWFPPVLAEVSTMWPDGFATALCVLGAGLVGSPRRPARIAGLVALAGGASIQPGGLVFVVPVVVGLLDEPRRRLAVAAGAAIAVALVAWATSRAFHWQDPHAVEHALADIAGTLHHAGGSDDLRPLTPTPEAAAAAYDPDARDVYAKLAPTFGAPKRADALAVRARVVGDHRGAYLAYRWDMFLRIVELRNRHEGSAAYVWLADAGLVLHDASPSLVQRKLEWFVAELGDTPLFVPYVYLLLALALLPMARRDRAIAGLLASGIAGELALFVVGHDLNFRHALWLVTTTMIATVALVGTRARPDRAKPDDVRRRRATADQRSEGRTKEEG